MSDKQASWTIDEFNQHRDSIPFVVHDNVFLYPISAHAKLVLMYCCWCDGKRRPTMPCDETIADACSITTRIAKRSINELIKHNLIIKKTYYEDEEPINYYAINLTADNA